MSKTLNMNMDDNSDYDSAVNAKKSRSSQTHQRQTHRVNKSTDTFKFAYTDEEIRSANQSIRRLAGKVHLAAKHEPESYIGISKVGYIRDPTVHKRGRSSELSNERTYGSQVRYLPGSIQDEHERVLPKPIIKFGKRASVALTLSSQAE